MADLLKSNHSSLFEKFLFYPPSPPGYNDFSFPWELYKLNDVVCLFLAFDGPCSHLIIYCHGNATDIGKSRPHLINLRDQLGMHVLAVEYPGYGTSEGIPSEESIDVALKRIYDFVRGILKWPSESIILFGRSIGSGPCLKLAGSNELGALVLVSAFTSIRNVIKRKIGKAAQLLTDRWNNLESISKVNCPVLLIHGQNDTLIDPQQSIELFLACSHSKTDIKIVESGHNIGWMPIANFLEDFLLKHENCMAAMHNTSNNSSHSKQWKLKPIDLISASPDNEQMPSGNGKIKAAILGDITTEISCDLDCSFRADSMGRSKKEQDEFSIITSSNEPLPSSVRSKLRRPNGRPSFRPPTQVN